MNKTISINIAGFIFNIEEKGYEMLNAYLELIKKNFIDENEREEIMRDIEARIAELFQLELSFSKEVVTLADVEKIISIMGEPKDYKTDDDDEPIYTEESTSTKNNSNKRLFRDKENSAIGGVCSGLAAYFNLDPVIFRLIFVFMFFAGGSGFLVYLVMLFVVPEAKTTAEKLQMRGEKINVDNIKKQFHDLKDDIIGNKRAHHAKKRVKNTVEKGIHASHSIFSALGKIIGFGLVTGGIFAAFLIISILIGETGIFPIWGDRNSESLMGLMDLLYQTEYQSTLTFASILLIIFIPISGAIYSGFKLLFDFKSNFKTMGIAMSIVWFLSVGVCAITGVQLGMEFREESEIREEITLSNSSDILNLEINDDLIFSNHININSPLRYSQLIKIEEDIFHIGTPNLKIIENETDSIFEIEVIKSSRGLSQREAIYKAENIQYKIEVDSNNVNLSPMLTLNKKDKLRNQEVTVIIKVPSGKSIHFGENIHRMPPLECTNCYSVKENKFKNSTWIMENNKLECLECE